MVLLTLYTGFIIIKSYRGSHYRRQRQQYMLILFFVFVPLIAGSLGSSISSLIELSITSINIYSSFLGLLLIWFGIVKIQLFPSISSVEIVISSVQEAMILADSKGIILSINKQMSDLSGYLESELTGKHISSVFTGNYDNTSDSSRELVLVTKDKKEIEQVIFISQVSNLNNQFSGYIYMLWNDVKAIKSNIELLRQKELLRTIINSFPYP